MSFKDKVALVTGGASGIGRGLAEELSRRGARVVVADMNETGAAAVAEGLTAARAVGLDVTDLAAVEAAVAEACEQEGHLDLMFNNAGIAVVGQLQDIEADHWQRLMDVNVRGVLNGVTAAYPRMMARGCGHIVNTASVAGLIPVPGMVHYAASKHAVVGLSVSLRAEAALYGVRVSAVCPQVIDTPMAHTAPVVNMDRERAMKQIEPIPLDVCISAILKGVARNRGIIMVGRQARFFHWLNRHLPWAGARLAGKMARRNASLRTPPEVAS